MITENTEKNSLKNIKITNKVNFISGDGNHNKNTPPLLYLKIISMKGDFYMHGCPSALFGNGPVSLSKGLSKLMDEHPPLRKEMDGLSSLYGEVKTNNNEQAFHSLVNAVTRFILNLEHHSRREEDYLFRVMEKYIGKNGGPIAVMEMEHERAHSLIDEFLHNAKKEQTIEEMKRNALLVEEAHYTLLNHFAKEEQVLYPMAENLLSDEEKQTLYENVSK